MTGVFLFNITMPVTLVMVSNMIAGEAGNGLRADMLALIAGGTTGIHGIRDQLDNPVFIVLVIVTSAAVLYYSLIRYRRESGIFSTKPEVIAASREVSEP
jgi:hypothetical protein